MKREGSAIQPWTLDATGGQYGPFDWQSEVTYCHLLASERLTGLDPVRWGTCARVSGGRGSEGVRRDPSGLHVGQAIQPIEGSKCLTVRDSHHLLVLNGPLGCTIRQATPVSPHPHQSSITLAVREGVHVCTETFFYVRSRCLHSVDKRHGKCWSDARVRLIAR